MSITKKPFGKAPCGREAELYVLTNASGASVEISNYGGILRAVNVPDRNGKIGSVTLGYSSVEGYTPLNGYIGALIGRVGNRIANGECTVSGQKLTLAKNENGITHLHGGDVGFDRRFWDATPVEGICEDSLILKYVSPDGEEGYPGTLRVMVTYTFTDDNELLIHYEAVSDRDTLCNLTNHSYFNLEGEGAGPVTDHVFEFNCDTFTVVDEKCIPTGEQRDVTGTPFDLRQPTRLADGLAQGEPDEQLRVGETGCRGLLKELMFGAYNKKFKPNRTANDWICSNAAVVDAYTADELCGFDATVGLTRDMLTGISMNQRKENLEKMDKALPVLFVSGMQDPVGAMGEGVLRCIDAFKRAGLKNVTIRLYPEGRHEMLNETNRTEVYADILSWMEQRL